MLVTYNVPYVWGVQQGMSVQWLTNHCFAETFGTTVRGVYATGAYTRPT